MEHIVDVTQAMGKCSLSYWGDKAEAAQFENIAVNHGNILEALYPSS